MRRLSHDLPGAMQRLEKLREQLQVEVDEVRQVWRDDVGREFTHRYLDQVGPAISQLVASLAGQIETVQRIMEQLRDPDRP